MPIDTSSYYPEVPSKDGDDYSLNKKETDLFGKPSTPPEPERRPDSDPVPSGGKKSKDSDESDAVKFINGVAHFLSVILVPLLMPVYGVIMAFGLSILDVAPIGMRIYYVLVLTGINVVFPMICILLMKKMGYIEDIGLNGRTERLVPYLLTTLCFLGSAWFMAVKGAPLWLTLFFAGGGVAAIVNTIINFWWKISAHAAGIAGVVALLIRIEKDGSAQPELFLWLILTILVAGLLGSARVWLGRHTVWQVLAGYAVGFCSVFFLTMIR